MPVIGKAFLLSVHWHTKQLIMKHTLPAILFMLILPASLLQATVLIHPVKDTALLRHEPTATELTRAMDAFKALSGKERRQKFREVKRELKQFSAERQSGLPVRDNKALLIVIAILLPPLAIYLFEGEIRKCFWISILLSLLFWLPGVIYAIVIITKDWKKYHPAEKK